MRRDAERHHRRSIRLPAYDYAAGGTFFVTICAYDRHPLFGWVDKGAMRMNECGWILWEEWERSALIRPGMELMAHVVMPNHMHALFTLPPGFETADSVVGTHGCAPLQRPSRSLGSFVAGFKSTCTVQINRIRNTPRVPVWQRGYWEHIVRDEEAMRRIYEYIVTNPLRWAIDRENPDCDQVNAFYRWLQEAAPPVRQPSS